MLTGLLDRISKTLQLPVHPTTPPAFAVSFDPDTYTRENARQIFPTLPALNCFMGVCDDGFPMLIELEQAGNGAILIISDDPDGRTDLTQLMAESTAAANASVSLSLPSSIPRKVSGSPCWMIQSWAAISSLKSRPAMTRLRIGFYNWHCWLKNALSVSGWAQISC